MIIDRILKFIELKGLSKNKFYIETGLSNGFLDKVKDVGVSKVEQILNAYPEINPIWLLTGEGYMIIDKEEEETAIVKEYPVEHVNSIPPNAIAINIEQEAKMFDYNQDAEIFTNTHGNKFYIYPDGTIRIEVIKIPFPAYASYVECYFDEAKLKEDFNVITFKVDHIGRGYYLGFESTGDSMWNNGGYDTPSGADILGREISRHLWVNGFNKATYGFIIVTPKGIWHKDIKEITSSGNLVLVSRNPECQPFEYPIDDVKQIFHVIKRSF